MEKKQKDLVKGDIIRVEFGDYDNWVTVVVDEVCDTGEPYGCCIKCHYLCDGEPLKMYGEANDIVEVVGQENGTTNN